MKFLIDADCPRSLAKVLLEAGHQVQDIRDTNPNTPDEKIHNLIQKESLVLITRDTDFGNILRYPVTPQCGIILLRVLVMPVPDILALVRDVVARLPEKEILGSLTVVRKNRIRTYRF